MFSDRSRRAMNARMLKINEAKLSRSVFDERIRDQSFKKHKEALLHIQKKVDNDCPQIENSQFFSQMKFLNAQSQIKNRMKINVNFLNYLNIIQRTTGKVDCHNKMAGVRLSKLPQRIDEQKHIDYMNRKLCNIIKTKEPTDISSRKVLRAQFEIVSRPKIITDTKYAIVINNVMTTNIDGSLENPPSHEEYKKNPKVLFFFHIVNNFDIGEVKILVTSNQKPFISLLQKLRCTGLVVTKSMKGVAIEIGDHSLGSFECAFDSETNLKRWKIALANDSFGNFKSDLDTPSETNSQKFPYGTVSMLLDDDGLVLPKFAISLKTITKTRDRQIVVGRVVKGLEVIAAIESYGSRFGKPWRTIAAKNWGVFK